MKKTRMNPDMVYLTWESSNEMSANAWKREIFEQHSWPL